LRRIWSARRGIALAEEILTIAERAMDPSAKLQLLTTTKAYERMAASVERRMNRKIVAHLMSARARWATQSE